MPRGASFCLKSFLIFLLFSLIYLPSFSQECGYIYISPTGATTGAAGTKSTPASLAYGLSLVSSSDNYLRIASGTYNISSVLTIPSGVTLEGGFDAATWDKSNATLSVIHRDANNILPLPNRLIALQAVNVSNFRLLDLTIDMDDASGDGTSTYGIYLYGCSNYLISRCKINAGDATDGTPGTTGTPGMAGANGQNGETGQEEGDCCKQGGVGACCSFAGSFQGGAGGKGADWGYFDIDTIFGYCYADEFETNDGLPGTNGMGLGLGTGGKGGMGLCDLQYEQNNCVAQMTNHGQPGGIGADGIQGFDGAQGTASYTGGYYIPGTGLIGFDGTNGAGGGGGGGGGAKGCEPAIMDPQTCDTIYSNNGSGGGGGGGGEGGQNGYGGYGGNGGGASFAIFIWGNGQNGNIRDCVLNPGVAGQGGQGGAGGTGGAGGIGGQGGFTGANGCCNSCNVGEGGDGGNGGKGGNGGNGGKGSDGASIAVYQQNNGYPALVYSAYNPFEPQITVSYFGCSNSDVVFSTNAIGNLNWVFGYGAIPQTGTAASDTVNYDSGTPGFRTITLIVDGVPYSFANFINIKNDFTPPFISAGDTIVCSGMSTTLSTLSSALSYDWDIPGGSSTSSNNQSAGSITFDNAGDYAVTLTTTSCCGTHVTHQTIHVIDFPPVNLGPDTAICYTDPMPVLDAGNPGANYTWKYNGNLTGGNSQTLQTFQPGTYTVLVTYPGCANSDTFNIEIYTSLPIDLGDDIYICPSGASPLLDAGLPNMQNYFWTLGGNPVGTNSQFLQTTVPGTYAVSITSPTGCTGTDSMSLFISDPKVNLGVNKTVCSNEPMPVLNAGNPGSTYYWYLNGSSTGSNAQTLQTTGGGIYSVTIINPYGCMASDSMTLTVLPSLTASFSAPASATVNTPVTLVDLSSPAPSSWNWNFGDGSPNDFTQNPSHTYASAGTYPIFLIVGNGLCYDTAVKTINILNDCAALGLVAGFTLSADTVYLSDLGMAFITNTSVNAVSYYWNFGDGTPPETGAEPAHTYTIPGTYTITLSAYNANCSDEISLVIVVLTAPIGIDELQAWNNGFMVFPNPFSAQINISYYLADDAHIGMEIFNMLGEKFAALPAQIQQPGFHKEFFDAGESGMPDGIYFLKILVGDEIFYGKIIRVKME